MALIDIGLIMERYMPITGHDCNIPSLLIDTQAPIDVLHDAAAYRIRAVTQLLENFVTSDEVCHNPIVLQEMTLACAILLRDGCDLLDVVGRKLQKQLSI
jgi:hypothetical protein